MAVDSKYPPSVKAGKPILSELPTGWIKGSLSNYLNLVPRKVKLKDDQEYDLLTVKRSRGGIVRREHLLGSQILVKSQFEVKAGDFVISKRQIVHGACELVPNELDGSIVSNEYSVFHAKPNFDLTYLKYLSATLYFQQTCFHSSIGVHIEKMIFKLEDWFKWDFNIPPLPEQQKIAKILSTWDKAISTTEALIDNSKQQKKALMQQLLTGKKRFAGFEGEWEEVAIGSILSIGSGKDYKHLSSGDIPVYGSGGHMLNVSEYLYDGDSVCIGRKGTIDKPMFLTGKFWTVDTLFFTHSFINLLPQFLYQYFLTINWRKYSEASGVPSLSKSIIEKIKIKLPTVSEQALITGVLSNADKEIELLEKQLSDLKQEKKALMQQLLTGKRRVKVDESEAALP